MSSLNQYLKSSIFKSDKVFYHGSHLNNITVFNGGHRGIIYVTQDQSYAEACSQCNNGDEHVYDLHVNITKLAEHTDPVVMDIITSVFDEVSSDEITEAFETGMDVYEFFENEEVIHLLKSSMYDGVSFYEEGQRSIGVFFPNQIKSASSNSGAYSENSDNIYE